MKAWDADRFSGLSMEYRLVEELAALADTQPHSALATVAEGAGLAREALERAVARWAGIGAGQLLQLLAEQDWRRLPAQDAQLADAGSAPRFTVTWHEAMPGSHGGQRPVIAYGLHPSPFGQCVLAAHDEGLCGLAFLNEGERPDALQVLQKRWQGAEWVMDPARTRPLLEQVFAPSVDHEASPLRLLLVGTRFQMAVWEALLRVPFGDVTSYGRIAAAIGTPRAARAVGQAVGLNPIAYLVPCHRVIRRNGALGGYRWGMARKRAMLAWEAAHRA